MRLGRNTILDPAWSTSPVRVWYSAHDVTGALLPGTANAIAVYMGNGWADVSPNPYNGSSTNEAWLRSILPKEEADAVLSTDFDAASPTTNWTIRATGLTRLRTREGLSEAALRNLQWDTTGAVPKVRAQLHVTYSDGSSAIFTSSAANFTPKVKVSEKLGFTPATWECGSGALVSDSVYDGCTWDAQYETLGWDVPGFNTTGWLPAT